VASARFAEAVTAFAATSSPAHPAQISPMTAEGHSCLRCTAGWGNLGHPPGRCSVDCSCPSRASVPRDACIPRQQAAVQHHKVSGLPSSPQQGRGPSVTHSDSCDLCKAHARRQQPLKHELCLSTRFPSRSQTCRLPPGCPAPKDPRDTPLMCWGEWDQADSSPVCTSWARALGGRIVPQPFPSAAFHPQCPASSCLHFEPSGTGYKQSMQEG